MNKHLIVGLSILLLLIFNPIILASKTCNSPQDPHCNPADYYNAMVDHAIKIKQQHNNAKSFIPPNQQNNNPQVLTPSPDINPSPATPTQVAAPTNPTDKLTQENSSNISQDNANNNAASPSPTNSTNTSQHPVPSKFNYNFQ